MASQKHDSHLAYRPRYHRFERIHWTMEGHFRNTFTASTFPTTCCLLVSSRQSRNVPGVALYMTSLTQLRALMATSPYFARVRKHPNTYNTNSSVLPTLTNQGNLLAGATTRVGVGFILNPFSVLKARFEVCIVPCSTTSTHQSPISCVLQTE